MHPPIEHRGFYPIHALPTSLRRDLDVIFDNESLQGAARERQIAEVKAKIRAEIEKKSNRRTADDRLILSFESDQEILFEQGREWKISFLDTNVDRAGERNPSKWTVRMNASLDQVMQGIPRPAQLLHSELIMKEAASSNCLAGRHLAVFALPWFSFVSEGLSNHFLAGSLL